MYVVVVVEYEFVVDCVDGVVCFGFDVDVVM